MHVVSSLYLFVADKRFIIRIYIFLKLSKFNNKTSSLVTVSKRFGHTGQQRRSKVINKHTERCFVSLNIREM